MERLKYNLKEKYPKPSLKINTREQLKNLLDPSRTEEQATTIKKIRSQIKELKELKDPNLLKWIKENIQKAKDLELDTTRDEEEFSVLEKEAYIQHIIYCFRRTEKSPN